MTGGGLMRRLHLISIHFALLSGHVYRPSVLFPFRSSQDDDDDRSVSFVLFIFQNIISFMMIFNDFIRGVREASSSRE